MPRTPFRILKVHSPWVYASTHPSPSKNRQEKGLPEPKETEFPYPIARNIASDLVRAIREKHENLSNVSIAGSIRRERQVTHDIDILISPSSEAVRSWLRDIGEVVADGPHKISVVIQTGIWDSLNHDIDMQPIQIDFRFIPPESWGPALQYFTGSREHNISLRRRAKQTGFRLNEYGLFDSSGRRIDDNSEGDIYVKLGLKWLPAKYREGFIGSYGEESKTDEQRGICSSCKRKHHRPYPTCTCCFDCIYVLEKRYST